MLHGERTRTEACGRGEKRRVRRHSHPSGLNNAAINIYFVLLANATVKIIMMCSVSSIFVVVDFDRIVLMGRKVDTKYYLLIQLLQCLNFDIAGN